MEVTTKDGQVVKISNEEVKRVAETYANMHGAETNDEFMERAQDNIEAVTGMRPTTEDEAKAILYKFMPGWAMKHVEIIFETMEYIASMHSEKTKIL